MLNRLAPVSSLAHEAPVMMHAAEEVTGFAWHTLEPTLIATFGPDVTEAWLMAAHIVGVHASAEGHLLTLAVPSAFFAQKLQTNYLGTLEEIVSRHLNTPTRIQLQVAPHMAKPVAAGSVPQAHTLTHGAVPEAAPVAGSRLDPRYTFAMFVTGKSNTFAFTAAQSVADTLARGEVPGFNPFFLHGGVGLGKTHLMQAIGHAVLAARPGARTLYLSAEQFMNMFIAAMREKAQHDFKRLFRGVDVLMIDDIQFITGRDNTQEEFFHTFNALVAEGKQIILTADRPPHDLVLEERLKSRLGSGLTVEVHPPAEETRMAILQTKAQTMNIPIGQEVLRLLAHHIASNVRELEGALNRLVAYHRLTGSVITEALAREQLRDVFRAYTRILSVEDIQHKVAAHFNIRVADMHSPRRAREVARPRQVAMYLAKQLTQRSYPDIGRSFGGRDHTTVMHACQQIDNLLPRDALLAEHVQLLMKTLTGRP
jgi:chromosomal replication initiator protein